MKNNYYIFLIAVFISTLIFCAEQLQVVSRVPGVDLGGSQMKRPDMLSEALYICR